MTVAEGVLYTYDAHGRVATRDGISFEYSGLELQPTTDGTTHIARSPAGSPVAAGDGTSSLHLGADRHGDVVAAFDGGGIADTVSYDPFGEQLVRNGSTELMVGYQGHYTDPTTGLVGMGARWYQASTGSFVSRDTYHGNLSTPVSLNRYTYANNNPMDFFDPDGRRALDNRFLEANGVYKTSKPKKRPAWKPTNRFLEANGVYKTSKPKKPGWKPTNRFLEANGVTAPPQPRRWTPPNGFPEANGVISPPPSTTSLMADPAFRGANMGPAPGAGDIRRTQQVAVMANEADVDFATMGSHVLLRVTKAARPMPPSLALIWYRWARRGALETSLTVGGEASTGGQCNTQMQGRFEGH